MAEGAAGAYGLRQRQGKAIKTRVSRYPGPSPSVQLGTGPDYSAIGRPSQKGEGSANHCPITAWPPPPLAWHFAHHTNQCYVSEHYRKALSNTPDTPMTRVATAGRQSGCPEDACGAEAYRCLARRTQCSPLEAVYALFSMSTVICKPHSTRYEYVNTDIGTITRHTVHLRGSRKAMHRMPRNIYE